MVNEPITSPPEREGSCDNSVSSVAAVVPARVLLIENVVRAEHAVARPLAAERHEVAGAKIAEARVTPTHRDRHETARQIVADDCVAAPVVDALDDAAQ